MAGKDKHYPGKINSPRFTSNTQIARYAKAYRAQFRDVLKEDEKMKTIELVPVSATPAFYYTCLGCGNEFLSSSKALYADLRGEPYKAYWCCDCADIVGTGMAKHRKENGTRP